MGAFGWMRSGMLCESEVTQADLKQLESYLDQLYGQIDIDINFTRHFLDRVNDARNPTPITIEELTKIFKDEFRVYGRKIGQLGPDAEAVMKDMETNVNIPFVLNWDRRNEELDLIAKTAMKKKNFKTSNPEFPV